MFNCDMPLRHRGAQSCPFRRGVLGCLDVVHGESLDSMSEDYAERTSDKVVGMIQEFATPLGETEPDKQIVEKFSTCTKSIVVDGALQKTARVMRTRFFRGLVLISRDPAHMVRLACSEPLCRTRGFEEQHRRLFSGRHALLKDVQYSHQMQARLEACQEEVIASQGDQGGVQHILRHFSFAPQRWESFAAPRRQYACLLQAIFKCLGSIAQDTRFTAEKRQRALNCMDAMTAKDILESGLAGDYSEICMRSAGATVMIFLGGG